MEDDNNIEAGKCTTEVGKTMSKQKPHWDYKTLNLFLNFPLRGNVIRSKLINLLYMLFILFVFMLTSTELDTLLSGRLTLTDCRHKLFWSYCSEVNKCCLSTSRFISLRLELLFISSFGFSN